MPSTGIEPATLRSLARRSNQLSYATASCPELVLTSYNYLSLKLCIFFKFCLIKYVNIFS